MVIAKTLRPDHGVVQGSGVNNCATHNSHHPRHLPPPLRLVLAFLIPLVVFAVTIAVVGPWRPGSAVVTSRDPAAPPNFRPSDGFRPRLSHHRRNRNANLRREELIKWADAYDALEGRWVPTGSPPATEDINSTHIPNPENGELDTELFTQNEGSECAFSVDPQKRAIDPIDEQQLRICGGPITRFTPDPDPMLVCNEFTRQLYGFAFGLYKPGYRRRNVLAESTMKAVAPLLKYHSNFGCWTAARGPEGGVLFGYVAGGFASLTVRSRRIIDLGSSGFAWRYATGEMGSDHDDASRAASKLQQIANRLFGRISTSDSDRRSNHSTDNEPSRRDPGEQFDEFPPVTGHAAVRPRPSRHLLQAFRGRRETILPRIRGHALIVPAEYRHSHLGQQFQEWMLYVSRAYTSGVLDLPSLSIVAYRADDNGDHAMRAWLEPLLLAAGIRIVWLRTDTVVPVEHAWFVQSTGVEQVEACATLFAKEWLLPRALRSVRADFKFHFGKDEDERPDETPETWAARTFPRQVAILKQAGHSRNPARAFQFRSDTVSWLALQGFAWVDDSSPFHFRAALLGHATLVLTTFGALQAMLGLLTSNGALVSPLGQPTPHEADGNTSSGAPQSPANRGANATRYIVLMHRGYFGEREWWAPGPCRAGVQDGLPVIVTPFAALLPQGTWAKLIVVGSDLLGNDALTTAHLSFTADDCTLDPAKATDFESTRRPWDPLTRMRRVQDSSVASWRTIPHFGFHCPAT